MKAKHNKKRNTAFLYETLVRELTKSIIANQKSKTREIKKIFKESFAPGSALKKELECYKTLSETTSLDHYTAEKMIFHAKKEHELLSEKEIFESQSSLLRKINTTLGTEALNNFVPNYRAYATVAQIFGKRTPVKTRVLLEKQILDFLTSKEETPKALEPVDSLVLGRFTERFNNQYSNLLPEQKNLLTKYIVSVGDGHTDFQICVGNELKRIREAVTQSLDSGDVSPDSSMVKSTHRVLEQIGKFNISRISEEDILTILKLQTLVKEYQTDAN